MVFGLYHGLVLLPVLLSWVGPAHQESTSVSSSSLSISTTINTISDTVSYTGECATQPDKHSDNALNAQWTDGQYISKNVL